MSIVSMENCIANNNNKHVIIAWEELATIWWKKISRESLSHVDRLHIQQKKNRCTFEGEFWERILCVVLSLQLKASNFVTWNKKQGAIKERHIERVCSHWCMCCTLRSPYNKNIDEYDHRYWLAFSWSFDDKRTRRRHQSSKGETVRWSTATLIFFFLLCARSHCKLLQCHMMTSAVFLDGVQILLILRTKTKAHGEKCLTQHWETTHHTMSNNKWRDIFSSLLMSASTRLMSSTTKSSQLQFFVLLFVGCVKVKIAARVVKENGR